MAGHFECIGVPGGEEEATAFLRTAAEAGVARERADGGSEILWRDGSGAVVRIETSAGGEILCAAPSFLGRSGVPVQVNGVGEDPECRFCSRLFVDVLDDEGELAYPLAVELEEPDAVIAAVPAGERRSLRVTAFPDSLAVWPSEAAYEDAVRGDEAPLAPRSLVPVGFFTPPERRGLLRRRVEQVPTAHALVTGEVAGLDERRNEATGAPFWWAQVETFGGRYDTVVPPADAAGLGEGAVVQLEAWLIGSLADS